MTASNATMPEDSTPLPSDDSNFELRESEFPPGPAANDTARVSVANGDVGAPPGLLPKAKLSQLLWGDWQRAESVQLESGLRVHYGSTEEAQQFMAAHHADIFRSEVSWYSEELTSAKTAYYRFVADLFVFQDGDEPVGLFVGNPQDWSNYYIRLAAILPKYQGHHAMTEFAEHLYGWLKAAGVARVDTDTAPSNCFTQSNFVKQQYVVSGTLLTERWGALIRYTKYLNPDAEGHYLDKFCVSGRLHRTLRQKVYGKNRGVG